MTTDEKLERAARDEAWRRLKGKHDTDPIAKIIRSEWFEAGAAWERERSKVLINALKRIAEDDNKYAPRHYKEIMADEAMKEYEGER